ncbi:hypothetical protein NC651_014204 [Populus alba x Populus x berolinensis]|nr:hypothetical protein NC651_014204 [Populus alba x Populus x berolinensis]
MAEIPTNLLPDEASPEWMNKGDNAWQLTAATPVGLQSVPGLVILYGSIVVGPRTNKDRERFPPNNILLMLAGAGLLWMGWSGFNGGGPFAASTDASLAILNTHVCTATSLLTWLLLDIVFFGKPSVIGATQDMITGLVCITPAAGNITHIYITIHLFLPFLAIILCKLILIFSRPLSFGNIGSKQLNFLRD